ncbi:MAG: DUF116 domain-containing protein [Bacteroidales bacterium]|jgi:hypothetical protein|nr:DUF116 domain-containing protein [Bacteroidales bacterium]
MKQPHPEYPPVNGKTYSLFGNSDSTSGYYETIRKLADEVINNNPLTTGFIEEIRIFSRGKRNLRRCLKNNDPGNRMSAILSLIDPQLRKYTEKVDEHLRKLPITKFWDFRLSTTREQYHLYMLEIELTNRLYASEFLKADRKIALMPYCLQDFSVSCKAGKNGFDYQCKHCSKICYQNHASMILEENNIEPYIWMGGDMKQLAKYTLHEKRTFGVLGIACVPELTNGMRTCRKNHIPVVGIPLNGNCCIRWHEEFFPNSIDLEELERMLKQE